MEFSLSKYSISPLKPSGADMPAHPPMPFMTCKCLWCPQKQTLKWTETTTHSRTTQNMESLDVSSHLLFLRSTRSLSCRLQTLRASGRSWLLCKCLITEPLFFCCLGRGGIWNEPEEVVHMPLVCVIITFQNTRWISGVSGLRQMNYIAPLGQGNIRAM